MLNQKAKTLNAKLFEVVDLEILSTDDSDLLRKIGEVLG